MTGHWRPDKVRKHSCSRLSTVKLSVPGSRSFAAGLLVLFCTTICHQGDVGWLWVMKDNCIPAVASAAVLCVCVLCAAVHGQ